MSKTIRYGIKFPITVASDDKTLLDLNTTAGESVNSKLMHVIFTPKGQKLRDPLFGTDLIQFIFNPNDNQTWEDVRREVQNAVNAYVPECQLKDIEIASSEDGLELFAKINYSVNNNGDIENYQTITKL